MTAAPVDSWRGDLVRRAMIAGAPAGAAWGAVTAAVVYGDLGGVPLGAVVMALPGAVVSLAAALLLCVLPRRFAMSTTTGPAVAFVAAVAVQYWFVSALMSPASEHMLFRTWYVAVPVLGGAAVALAAAWAIRRTERAAVRGTSVGRA
ncbi:hypothetical protein [Kitasatospora sp. NBC_01539]|uniref:hypothetical protein n=1 Tax=Kitasatospora sp. NBC_01539 TaxID=2903577 RepID=UPI0038600BB6